MDYKKKKLKFPKGIKTIRFPLYKPAGDFRFMTEAKEYIESIKNKYDDRKNVKWDFIVSHNSSICEVTVSKIK